MGRLQRFLVQKRPILEYFKPQTPKMPATITVCLQKNDRWKFSYN